MKVNQFWLWLKDDSNLKPFSFLVSSVGGLVAALVTGGWFLYTKLPTATSPPALSSAAKQELLGRLRSASLSKCESPAGLLRLQVEHGLPSDAMTATAEAMLKELVRNSNCFILVDRGVTRIAQQEERRLLGEISSGPLPADYVLVLQAALDAGSPSRTHAQLLMIDIRTGVQLASSAASFNRSQAQALFGQRLSGDSEPEKYLATATLLAYSELAGIIETSRRNRRAP